MTVSVHVRAVLKTGLALRRIISCWYWVMHVLSFTLQVHNSYITFIDLVIGVAKTDLFPDADRPLSGFIVDLTKDHATCGWISTTDAGQTKGEIVCVDPANANYSRCDESNVDTMNWVAMFFSKCLKQCSILFSGACEIVNREYDKMWEYCRCTNTA